MRIFALAIIVLFTLAPSALAAVQTTGSPTTQTQTTGTPTSGQNTTLINPLSSGTSLESLLTDILGFVIRIGAIFVALMIVYVGFLFVNARGNSEQLSQARRMLLWTVVGALILLGAQAIATGIEATARALSTGS